MSKYSFRKLAQDSARAILMLISPIFGLRSVPERDKAAMMHTKKLKGGYLIIANHTSMRDPIVLQQVFWRRRVSFVAASDVMGGKFRSALLRGAGCIGIDREIFDFACIKQCIEVLKGGDPIIMFPEGRINQGESSFKSGMILMAVRADAPIVPVYLSPNRGLFRRTYAVIGEPVNIKELVGGGMPTKDKLDSAAEFLSAKEDELKKIYESKYKKGE